MGFLTSLKAAGKSLDNLNDLMTLHLKEMYDMEDRLIAAYPKLAESASSPRLKDAFRQQEERNKTQKHRLEQVFGMLQLKPEKATCDGIKGIITENEIIEKTTGDPNVKDAALIAEAQRMIHYEIAAYGCARTFAQYMGRSDISDILQQSLDEEGSADEQLNEIAMSGVNREAAE